MRTDPGLHAMARNDNKDPLQEPSAQDDAKLCEATRLHVSSCPSTGLDPP